MEIKSFKELVAKFGEFQTRSNDEVGFDCPKCGRGRKKYHLGVNLKKKVWNCFKCGYAGRFGGSVAKVKPTIVRRQVKALIPGYNPLITDGIFPAKYVKFVTSRGISPRRAMKLRWGWSDGVKLDGRLIIPIIEDGEFVYYVARSINGQTPKELSPKKEESWLPRSEVLYGLDDVPVGCDTLVLVEGVFDAERIKEAGYHSVALLGSNLSDVQVGKILSRRPVRIVLMFDGDDGGRIGCTRALSKLLVRFKGKLRTASLPEGLDPDELEDLEIRKYVEGTEYV